VPVLEAMQLGWRMIGGDWLCPHCDWVRVVKDDRGTIVYEGRSIDSTGTMRVTVEPLNESCFLVRAYRKIDGIEFRCVEADIQDRGNAWVQEYEHMAILKGGMPT